MTLSRTGQRNGTGGLQANFPKVLKQAVINSFMRECVVKDRHRIEQGSGSSIYVTSRGLTEAKTRDQADINEEYQATSRIIGQQTVLLEDERYSRTNITDWDRVQRQEQTFDDLQFDAGTSLARQWDQALLMMIAKGAGVDNSALNPTFKIGAQATLAASTTAANVTGPQLVKATVGLSSLFDENDVGKDLPRYLAISGTHHGNMMVDKSDTVQNPLDTRVGTGGNLADAQLAKVGSVMLLPNSVLAEIRKLNVNAAHPVWGTTGGSGKASWKNNLIEDYRKVAGIMWNPQGVMTGMWQPLSVVVHAGTGDAYLDSKGYSYCLARMKYGVKFLYESCCGRINFP